MSNNRKRSLLDLAHEVEECTNCGAWTGRLSEGNRGCDPAHENGIEAGKGQSIKSQDNRHAALCAACHKWYDSGRGIDPSSVYDGIYEDKEAMFNRAHKRTFDLYWANGWIKVAA